jgi:hypothetical protein
LPRLRLQGTCIRIGLLRVALRLLQLQLGPHGLAYGCAGGGRDSGHENTLKTDYLY